MAESISDYLDKTSPISTKHLLASLMRDISDIDKLINQDLWHNFAFNPYPKKEYYKDKEIIMEKVSKIYKKPQQWERVPFKNKESPNIPFFATKPILKEWTLSDERYKIAREGAWKMIENVFGMFPKESIEEKCVAIFIWNLMPFNGWAFDTIDRVLHLPWNFRENAIYHELIHGILLHSGSDFYTKRWIQAFWDGWQNAYSTIKNGWNPWNYSQYEWSKGEIYGMTNAREDMATIWQYIFYREGWEILRIQMFRGPLLQKKIDTLILFLSKETWWKLNEKYFKWIENGTIKDTQSAQDFFKKEKTPLSK